MIEALISIVIILEILLFILCYKTNNMIQFYGALIGAGIGSIVLIIVNLIPRMF